MYIYIYIYIYIHICIYMLKPPLLKSFLVFIFVD